MKEIKYKQEDDIPMNQAEFENGFLDFEDEILKKAVDSILGMGPDGEPNAIFEAAIVKIEENKPREKYHYIFNSAKITMLSFVRHFAVMEIDFMNPHSIWIQKCLDLLRDFHAITDKSEYKCVFTAINRNNSVNMYFCLMDPLIFLQGYSSESKASTIIQLLFDIEQVKLEPNDIDYDAVRADAYREAEMDELEEEKRAENEFANQAAMEAINAGTPLEDDFLGMNDRIRTSGTLRNADKHFRSSDDDNLPVNPHE